MIGDSVILYRLRSRFIAVRPCLKSKAMEQRNAAKRRAGGSRGRGRGEMCDLRRGGFSPLSRCGLALMGIQPKHRHPIERGGGGRASCKMTVFRRVSSEEDTPGGRIEVFLSDVSKRF